MKPLITAVEINKAFGGLTLLRDATIRIDEGDKIGFVGRNGAGKTTFFNMILGRERVDAGDLKIRDGLEIGWLSQYQIADSSRTVAAELQESQYLSTLRTEIETINARFADPDFYSAPDYDDVMGRYSELQTTLAKYDGAALNTRAQEVLERLGFDAPDPSQPVHTLSGGERRKVALARLLVAVDQLDLILLDEPTNHLDLAAIEWLEEFLCDYTGAAIIISHDRYFLDNTVDYILELDRQRFSGYTGNYTDYEELKHYIQLVSSKRAAKRRAEIARQRAIIQKLRGRNKYDAQIKSRLKRLEKREPAPDPVVREKSLKFSFTGQKRPGRLMANFHGVAKSFGSNLLFKGVDLEIRPGETIGLLGPNGSGKTTLLKLITGDESPTAGTIDRSSKLRVGYFDQGHLSLAPGNTLIEEIQCVDEKMHDNDAKALLGRFGFPSTMFRSKIRKLSGGERARLAILKLIMSPYNLLLLDEPTNHLDIPSRKAVEMAITSYPGTVIVSSHDRYFLDTVVTRVLHIHDHGIHSYPGGYTSFKVRYAAELEAAADGDGYEYEVTKSFTDWSSGTKYRPGDTVTITGPTARRFQWALDTGRLQLR